MLEIDELSDFEKNISLKQYTTFKIGGNAKYFIAVYDEQTLKKALSLCKIYNFPFFVLGKGSNTLFDDRGFNGVVILNKIDFFQDLGGGRFSVGAGYSFSLLGNKLSRLGWSGLEFASGIPGSVGGAIFMNAGANGQEVSFTVEKVLYLHENGLLQEYTFDQINFSYRKSIFQELRGVIVSVIFSLRFSNEARNRQLKLIDYRKKTQPYSEKSAGCAFRNPKNNFAGALIEKVGLKGFKVGEACVSLKHANFIINESNASSTDVLKLIQAIKDKVYEETGIHLESEILYVPYK